MEVPTVWLFISGPSKMINVSAYDISVASKTMTVSAFGISVPSKSMKLPGLGISVTLKMMNVSGCLDNDERFRLWRLRSFENHECFRFGHLRSLGYYFSSKVRNASSFLFFRSLGIFWILRRPQRVADVGGMPTRQIYL